ncbi:class I SAM-dependent methyltransferase [Nitrosopumilus piranensis]|uniref:class I SAM-dependent methyltransferase n=1 Tax=Nitrosopumilus piranensis TaxID=1582439 RepID=UPI0011E5DED9|nr:class I SAM-dependent methyltransferase [Nitrosopumilus piranensis]
MSEKIPFLKPYAFDYYHKNLIGAKFTGWGMKTEHELPWNDEYSGKIFNKTCEDVQNFNFSKSFRMNENTLDELRWRHWIVRTATLHALKFAKSNEYNFVECGVGDGITSFFTMREIANYPLRTSDFSMHLYDAWAAMKKDRLLESELDSEGKYAELDFERTKNNLSEFKKQIVFHKGYIPSTFNSHPDSPDSIRYLHIDLNATAPTIDSLEFFLPKLAPGGVILFDDYGWAPYYDTKKAIDEFFSDKPGILMKLPTAQAIYYN